MKLKFGYVCNIAASRTWTGVGSSLSLTLVGSNDPAVAIEHITHRLPAWEANLSRFINTNPLTATELAILDGDFEVKIDDGPDHDLVLIFGLFTEKQAAVYAKYYKMWSGVFATASDPIPLDFIVPNSLPEEPTYEAYMHRFPAGTKDGELVRCFKIADFYCPLYCENARILDTGEIADPCWSFTFGPKFHRKKGAAAIYISITDEGYTLTVFDSVLIHSTKTMQLLSTPEAIVYAIKQLFEEKA